MANPQNDSYSAIAGAVIFGGRTSVGAPVAPTVPEGLPLWAAESPLNAWIPIPGTNQAISATNWAGPEGKPTNGGSQRWLDAWGAWCVTPQGVILAGVAGGHTDGEDNRVASVNLFADVPGWVTRTPKSPVVTYEQPYNAGGKPTSRHPYWSVFWSETLQRMIIVGSVGVSIGGNSNFPVMDGWDPVTDTWDPAGTYPYLPVTGSAFPSGVYPGPVGGHYYGDSTLGENGVSFTLAAAMDTDGNVWAGSKKYTVATGTWSTPLTATATAAPRAPWAVDTNRSQMFGLCWGDGQGSSEFLGMLAAKQAGNVQTQITFNASAATAQFAADRPQYGGMDYDPLNDHFLWYEGRRSSTATPGDTGRVGRVYVIKPNSSNVWDMSFFNYANGATPPAETVNAGMCKRFTYVPALGGFVMMPSVTSGLYFMRTA